MNTPTPDNNELIQRNLRGDYSFDIKSIFSRSWAITQGTIGQYLLMFSIILAISVITTMLIVTVFDIDLEAGSDMQLTHRASLEIILQLVLAPFMVAFYMAGVKFSAGERVNTKDLFNYLPRSAILCLTTLMLSLLIVLGMQLFILPGLYLLLATNFTLMLVADKQMSAISAMLLSVKMVNRYLGAFIIFYVIFFLLFILCVVTFGIALILVGPLYINTKGLLYKELFGYGNIAPNDHQTNSMESTFNA